MLEREETDAPLCIDDIFKQTGQFGKYQLLVLILAGLTSTMCGIIEYQVIFTDATPDHRCKLSTIPNDTYEIFSETQRNLVNLYIPRNNENKKYESCHYFANTSINSSTMITCNSWVYSRKYYQQTIVTDWNLVCTNIFEKGFYTSLMFTGGFSVIILGFISDRYGRKTTAYGLVILNAITFLTITLAVNLVTSVSTQKVLFAVSRFAMGFSKSAYGIVNILVLEIVGPLYRVMATNSIYYFYILGELIVLLVAYFARDYKIFSICITLIVSLLVTYYWWLPESVRYLINRKRFQEADAIFNKIAKSNKKGYTYSVKDLTDKNDTKRKRVPFKVYLTNMRFLLRIFVSLINWFTNSFVYYGISINTDLLGGDPYLNFLYFSIVEFFGVLLSHFVLIKYGRKYPYLINFFIIAITMSAIGSVPISMNWLKILLVLIVKFSISFNFNAIYVITIESYPTVIRNTALSTCCVAGLVASLLSPYIPLLSHIYFETLPYFLYGGLAALSGLLYFFVMPETKDVDLPENLEDINLTGGINRSRINPSQN